MHNCAEHPLVSELYRRDPPSDTILAKQYLDGFSVYVIERRLVVNEVDIKQRVSLRELPQCYYAESSKNPTYQQSHCPTLKEAQIPTESSHNSVYKTNTIYSVTTLNCYQETLVPADETAALVLLSGVLRDRHLKLQTQGKCRRINLTRAHIRHTHRTLLRSSLIIIIIKIAFKGAI